MRLPRFQSGVTCTGLRTAGSGLYTPAVAAQLHRFWVHSGIVTVSVVLGGVLLFAACSTGSPANSLEALLAEEQDPGRRSVLIETMAAELGERLGPGAQVERLLEAASDPLDSALAPYYLLLAAEIHLEQDRTSDAMVLLYRAQASGMDVTVGDTPLRFALLQQLAEVETDPYRTVQWLEELLAEYPDRVDRGLREWQLSEAYAAIGEWDAHYGAVVRFLAAPETRIPGVPDARRIASEALAFHRSGKAWVSQDLDLLVATIQQGIRARSWNILSRWQAGVGFFNASWEQEEFDFNARQNFDFPAFLLRNTQISISELETNDREAFLRTRGWEPRVPVWYFYFRRVWYPADPRYHLGWEWAGLYFGERL